MSDTPEQIERGFVALAVQGNFAAALEMIYDNADEIIDNLVSSFDRHQEEQFVALLRKVTRKLKEAADRIDERLLNERSLDEAN